jgi:hypothetical protein
VKPNLNAHLHSSYLSNTKLKLSFILNLAPPIKTGRMYSFESGAF